MSEFREFVEFEVGNIPLIVSTPHGGALECTSISKRQEGVLGIDKGTIDFSKDLIDQISQKFKNELREYKNVSYIFSKIRRSKIDLNRAEKKAYNQTSFLAREIYNLYHSKIKDWISNNIKMFSRSLLIDIHGFERDKRPPGYRDVDIILGTNNLESIFQGQIPKRDWGKNIRGNIIQKFLELNIPIAPGHPRRREYALTGGYITQTYGASHIAKSQTIQIEISDRIRMKDKKLRGVVITALSDVFYKDLDKSYKLYHS
jgi:N-formylglutamate amidohydrolase